MKQDLFENLVLARGRRLNADLNFQDFRQWIFTILRNVMAFLSFTFNTYLEQGCLRLLIYVIAMYGMVVTLPVISGYKRCDECTHMSLTVTN